MNTSRLALLSPIGLCALTGLLLSACGGDEGKVTGVQVEIWGPQGTDPFPEFSDDADPELLRFYGIRGIERVSDSSVDFRDGESTLPPIPYGDNSLLAVAVTNDPNDPSDTEFYVSGATTVRFNADPDGGITTLTGDAIQTLRIFTAPIVRFTTAFGLNDDQDETINSTFELGGESRRAGFTITELPDGRLVAIGGAQITIAGGVPTITGLVDTIEVFEPESGRWRILIEPECDQDTLQECAVRLRSPKAFHTASLLPDGRIVIVGGLKFLSGSTELLLASEVEVLTFTASLEGELDDVESFGDEDRAFHTATSLPDGRVIIAGGISQSYSSPDFQAAVDIVYLDGEDVIYESLEGIELGTPRALHAAEFFTDDVGGEAHGIIIAGGRNETDALASTELLYESGGEWTIQDGNPMDEARFGAAATRLNCPGDNANYWVLAGGFTGVAGPRMLEGNSPSRRFESYIPAESDWFGDDGEHLMGTSRAFAVSTFFPRTGDVIVVGGIGADGNALATADLLIQQDASDCADFISDSGFQATLPTNNARAFGQMVRLPSLWGYVFGGTDGTTTFDGGEYYNNNDYNF